MPQFRPRPTQRAQQLRNNATDAERKLWRYLRNRQLEGFKSSRQMPVGPFICDFLCRERGLVVEVDGGQHAENDQDARRTAFLEREGLRVIRIEGVLQAIGDALRVLPAPTPARQREGKSGEAAEGWA